LDEAPQFFTDKFSVDQSAIDDIMTSRPELPVLRLFLTNFNDDFGFYSKVYHKTKGRYLSLGNLPYTQQILLKNIVPITMSPPGTDAKTAVSPFVHGCKWLQDGHVLDLGPTLGPAYVTGGMGVATTDCPQGNDDAGCKRQNAARGCRVCLAPSSATSDCDTTHALRLKASMDSVRSAAASQPTRTAREAMLTDVGLKDVGSLYDSLPVDEWDVLPHDPFHLWVMGLLSLFLSLVAQSLTQQALDELNWLLFHAKPWFWRGSMPLLQLTTAQGSTRRNLKGRGEDLRKQIQILPLLLPTWLTMDKFAPRTWGKELLAKHHSATGVKEAI
jgi:hypothetical protein